MQENMFRDWLFRRRISDSVINEFNVHSGKHPVLGECIVIPVHDELGNFSFNKYRRNPISTDAPKYLYDKGAKILLYGASKIKNETTVLITEGEMDCLVAWSANIPAVSGTGGAMSFPIEWKPQFEDKEVIICFDNDKAGGEGASRVLEIIPHAKILFLPDRPDIKDISDYVSNGGNLNELIRTAKKFNSIEDVLDDKAERASIWQSTYFHDAYIKKHSKPAFIRPKKNSELTDKISRAKNFPITDLLSFTAGKAKCIWHKEKEPSLSYYPENNKVYCFGGCGRAYDAIDVYRQLNNCTFKEAVEKLQ